MLNPYSEQLPVICAENAPIALKFVLVAFNVKEFVKDTTAWNDHQPGSSCMKKALGKKESHTEHLQEEKSQTDLN